MKDIENAAASKPETATKRAASTKPAPIKDAAPVRPMSKKPVSTEQSLAVLGIKPYNPAKDEEYMSPEQLEHFKKILNAWRLNLMEEVDRIKGHMQDDAANYPDPVDRASQEEEFNLELRARDRERKLLKKINDALRAIGDEDYGYCDGCGVDIGIQRLEARPTATLCIDCKTIDEIKEKQKGM